MKSPPSDSPTRTARPVAARKPVRSAAPKSRQSLEELVALQRLAFSAIRRPLSSTGRTQRKWADGRPTSDVFATFIKPNDRLSSFERLEIYNRQYWFRLMDCLYDDYPGLRAIMGENAFYALRVAYLNQYPSRSFTLRNLGSHLEAFMLEHPSLVPSNRGMCMDMCRFEWAQVVAFDGPGETPLGVDDLLGKDPSQLRLGLQPYMTLLEVAYPLDEFLVAVKKQENSLRGEASNAISPDAQMQSSRRRAVKLPRPRRTHLVVHRYRNALFYKRIDAEAFATLAALRDGATVAEACETALSGDIDPNVDWAARIREWFQLCTELGWFCKPA